MQNHQAAEGCLCQLRQTAQFGALKKCHAYTGMGASLRWSRKTVVKTEACEGAPSGMTTAIVCRGEVALPTFRQIAERAVQSEARRFSRALV